MRFNQIVEDLTEFLINDHYYSPETMGDWIRTADLLNQKKSFSVNYAPAEDQISVNHCTNNFGLDLLNSKFDFLTKKN